MWDHAVWCLYGMATGAVLLIICLLYGFEVTVSTVQLAESLLKRHHVRWQRRLKGKTEHRGLAREVMEGLTGNTRNIQPMQLVSTCWLYPYQPSVPEHERPDEDDEEELHSQRNASFDFAEMVQGKQEKAGRGGHTGGSSPIRSPSTQPCAGGHHSGESNALKISGNGVAAKAAAKKRLNAASTPSGVAEPIRCKIVLQDSTIRVYELLPSRWSNSTGGVGPAAGSSSDAEHYRGQISIDTILAERKKGQVEGLYGKANLVPSNRRIFLTPRDKEDVIFMNPRHKAGPHHADNSLSDLGGGCIPGMSTGPRRCSGSSLLDGGSLAQSSSPETISGAAAAGRHPLYNPSPLEASSVLGGAPSTTMSLSGAGTGEAFRVLGTTDSGGAGEGGSPADLLDWHGVMVDFPNSLESERWWTVMQGLKELESWREFAKGMPNPDTFNLLLCRLLFPSIRREGLENLLKGAIRKKLVEVSKKKFPRFISGQIELDDFILGASFPWISDVSKPSISTNGEIGFDFNLLYKGEARGFALYFKVALFYRGIRIPHIIISLKALELQATLHISIGPPPSKKIWIGIHRPPIIRVQANQGCASGKGFLHRILSSLPDMSNIVCNALRLYLFSEMILPEMDDFPLPSVLDTPPVSPSKAKAKQDKRQTFDRTLAAKRSSRYRHAASELLGDTPDREETLDDDDDDAADSTEASRSHTPSAATPSAPHRRSSFHNLMTGPRLGDSGSNNPPDARRAPPTPSENSTSQPVGRRVSPSLPLGLEDDASSLQGGGGRLGVHFLSEEQAMNTSVEALHPISRSQSSAFKRQGSRYQMGPFDSASVFRRGVRRVSLHDLRTVLDSGPLSAVEPHDDGETEEDAVSSQSFASSQALAWEDVLGGLHQTENGAAEPRHFTSTSAARNATLKNHRPEPLTLPSPNADDAMRDWRTSPVRRMSAGATPQPSFAVGSTVSMNENDSIEAEESMSLSRSLPPRVHPHMMHTPSGNSSPAFTEPWNASTPRSTPATTPHEPAHRTTPRSRSGDRRPRRGVGLKRASYRGSGVFLRRSRGGDHRPIAEILRLEAQSMNRGPVTCRSGLGPHHGIIRCRGGALTSGEEEVVMEGTNEALKQWSCFLCHETESKEGPAPSVGGITPTSTRVRVGAGKDVSGDSAFR